MNEQEKRRSLQKVQKTVTLRLYPPCACSLSGGSALATPEAAENLQGPGLLWCTQLRRLAAK